mmetsp:Transcript_12768/g.27265  ORF Transcript_12768/g.27265 Transcript_12768/m.27265 type:complete len:243 (+) Transcript_12768:226-954(+)
MHVNVRYWWAAVFAFFSMISGITETAQLSSDGRFEARATQLGENVQRVRIFDLQTKTQLSWNNVIQLWLNRESALFFSSVLQQSPFETFYWECPPLTVRDLDGPYEHVTVQAHSFAPPNPSAFAAFITGKHGAVSFTNLGGDALLVSPCAPAERHARQHYGHLAAFARNAADDDKAAFWSAVANALRERLHTMAARPTWLSTEGSGVPWLHVRMDSEPKYYHTKKYINYPPGHADAARHESL